MAEWEGFLCTNLAASPAQSHLPERDPTSFGRKAMRDPTP
ncbi:hypothetical protein HMPREF1503_1078 [Olsenella uli MSTE5]|nr:hypothetical protein HMPREF1503_1078 [Olsenella uli MSTE5]